MFCIFFQSTHQVDMKKVFECYKDFLAISIIKKYTAKQLCSACHNYFSEDFFGSFYFELRSYCPYIYTVPCGTTIFLLMFELTVNLIIMGIINTLTIVFNNKVWPKFWQKANQNPAMHIIEVEIKVAFLGTEDS